MKRILQSFIFAALLLFWFVTNGQKTTLEIPIVQNGDPIQVELSNGTIITINTSSDDAEQENNEMDSLEDDDIDAGWEGDPVDQNTLYAGFRFQNVTIPKNAVIESAYVRVCSHEGKTAEDVARITIVGEASDNAETYSLEQLITDRPQTTASVMWEVAEPWDLWGFYNTIDISPVIQEIVNRAGWTSGNALALMFLGEDQGPSDVENAREMEAFENIADPEDGGDGQHHPERIPTLVVTYSVAGIDEIIGHQMLNIYPNPPVNGELNISLESDNPVDITIYNQAGQEVQTLHAEGSQLVKVNTQGLPKGIYVVKATQDNILYTGNLVIN